MVMGDRTVPFDQAEVCDICGRQGAYDFMGDLYCAECIARYLSPEEE
jgi:uncharacterized protein CbrC (UPF0167 family)